MRLSDVSKCARDFVEEVSSYSQRGYAYIAPNYVLRFTDQASKVVIGPVEAMKTECIANSQNGDSEHKSIHVGSKFDFSISEGRLLIELPEYCWFIPMGYVQAARRNAEEKAIWMINIAISLLRLCHPNPKQSDFPKIGDLEEMPITEPKKFWLGGGREEKAFVLHDVNKTPRSPLFGFSAAVQSSVRRMDGVYTIDDSVVKVAEDEGFKRKAAQIFSPGRKSLSERFGPGLGWLSRARQTSDRAERFLFFFTAIEALLCSDDKTAPVVQTISRHAAVILHDSPEERARLAASLRALYKVRSVLVHTGQRRVSQTNIIKVQQVVEELYRTVMERYPLDVRFDEFGKSLAHASNVTSWPKGSHE